MSRSTAASPETPSRWRAEPFRVFFPLGVVIGWIGVGHWLLYSLGVTATYSCFMHGIVQTQAFMMAFGLGFLLTALPRRTQSAPPSAVEMAAMGAALALTVGAALTERWNLSQLGYVALFLLLGNFALRRFAGARRPPASFVLIPIGVVHGLVGAALIGLSSSGDPSPWAMGLGRLFVEQGVFLCFVIGVGGLVLPLIGGGALPADFGSSPRESWRLAAFAAAGLAITASMVLEQWGWPRGGPLLRGAVVAVSLAFEGGAWRPAKPGVHRNLVWIAAWLMPVGLFVSALWPDYRVPALHILFIGGFSLMAFGVATHVSLGHLGMPLQAVGRPAAIVLLGVTFLLAMSARFGADMTEHYFDHLGWAAAMWLLGSGGWLAYLGPRLLGRAS